MSVLQTSVITGNGGSPQAGTIVIDSAAGNNRMVVAIIGVYDGNPATHNVVLDPGGVDEVTLTPLLNGDGNNTNEAAGDYRLHSGIFYALDADLPASAGTYNIELQYTLVDDGNFCEVFYIENATQGVPEIYGSQQAVDSSTPSVTISPSAGAFTLDGVVSNDLATTGYTADVGQTEVFESKMGTTYAFGSHSTAQTTIGWTDDASGLNNYLQAYASIQALDVAAPVLTLPDYSGLTSFAVTPQVDTDDATGNMYQVICLATVTAPNASQVVAGTDGDGNSPVDSETLPTSGTGTQTFSSTGNVLNPGTNYVIYYAQVDGGALVSNAPSVAFTTTGTTQVGDIKLNHIVGGEIDQVIPKPVLSNLTISDITYKTIVVTVETDTANGSLALVVVPNGDSPTVDQINQGLQSDGTSAIAVATKPVFAVGEQSFGTIFVSNDGNTPYEVYVVHTNITNTSSLSVTDGFTTLEAPEGTVPNIESYIKTIRKIDAGSDDPVTIYFEQPYDATYTDYYCIGRTDYFKGKAMWVRCTTTDNAEVKANEIIVVMRESVSDPDIGP